jgi:hypothetical protein
MCAQTISGHRQVRKTPPHDEADDQQMEDHHQVSARLVPHQVTLPRGHTQPTIDRIPDRLAPEIVHYCRDGGRLMRPYQPG